MAHHKTHHDIHYKKGDVTGLIAKLAMMVLLVIVGYYLVSTYIITRGGGGFQKLFATVEQKADVDLDGVLDVEDVCCASACNPLYFENRPVEKVNKNLLGCIISKQGPTPCEATVCNPPPASPAPTSLVS